MRHIKLSSMWVSLVVVLPLFWKGITCLVPIYSIQVSSCVSVQEGLCVTIPCSFTAGGRNTFSNSTGYWMRMPQNPYYIVATNNKSSDVNKTNFHLTGNPDAGDCTLTITDPRREDEGTYYFRFEESKDSKVQYNFIREMTTTITVTDLSEEPVISDLGAVIAGNNKTVTCAPPGNCSATSLIFQWKKSDVSDIWKNNSSTVTFTPSIDDDQKNITCEMTNSKGKTTHKTILLDVFYPPRNLKITNYSSKATELLTSEQVAIDESETLTLVCRADGNPTVTVNWGKGESDLEASKMSNSGLTAIINVTSSMADVYRCVAWNALGFRERWIKVVQKQGDPGPTAEPTSDDTILNRDVVIAFITGMSITVIIILLYKLIKRMKITIKSQKGRSASAELPTDDVYTNVRKPEWRAEEATDHNVQLDTRAVTSNQDVLYSTVAFTAKPSKVPSTQPESEYAQIKKGNRLS